MKYQKQLCYAGYLSFIVFYVYFVYAMLSTSTFDSCSIGILSTVALVCATKKVISEKYLPHYIIGE